MCVYTGDRVYIVMCTVKKLFILNSERIGMPDSEIQ